MNNRELKAQLRSTALACRDAMSVEARIEASLAIEQHGREITGLAKNAIVSGFWPIRSEVDVRPLLFAFQQAGAQLCLPVVVNKQTIVFRELLRGAQMIDTGFGIAGPGPQAAVLDPAIMLVPLAAFDATGHRIGYGAGYYDRAISNLQNRGFAPLLIGVAFDGQEVDAVPHEPHDMALNAILTQSGLRQVPADGS